ncbi:unnamed protein product, partial [Durusdinium trenchii]
MSGDWLRNNLARPIDGASLGLFRILWGLLMVWESIRKLPKADGMYSPTFFHFKYEHFYFVEPLPEIWMMQAEITLMLIAAIFVTIGWFYRPAAAVFLVVFTHLFLIEKIYYNNHFYLTILIGFLLMFCQADRCFRLPMFWKKQKSSEPSAQQQAALFPTRIWLYEQNPGWTEVGQCFSWRMMLRTKDAFMHLKFDPPEAERYLEQHPEILPVISEAHVLRMSKNPLFIKQYVQKLDSILEAEGITDVEIRCIGVASMNGRPYQFLVDPEVDLTQVSSGLWEVPDWIVPLDKHRKPGQYPQNPAERKKMIAGVYQDYIEQRKPDVENKKRVKY